MYLYICIHTGVYIYGYVCIYNICILDSSFVKGATAYFSAVLRGAGNIQDSSFCKLQAQDLLRYGKTYLGHLCSADMLKNNRVYGQ